MTCSRCTAEAVVKRGNTAYCAKCALIRDWEEIIQIVQEERISMGGPDLDFSTTAKAPAPEKREAVAHKAPLPAAGAPSNGQGAGPKKEKASSGARAKGEPSSNGPAASSLPADPFA